MGHPRSAHADPLSPMIARTAVFVAEGSDVLTSAAP